MRAPARDHDGRPRRPRAGARRRSTRSRDSSGPVYLRARQGRRAGARPRRAFELGRARLSATATIVALVALGQQAHAALGAAELLARHGIAASRGGRRRAFNPSAERGSRGAARRRAAGRHGRGALPRGGLGSLVVRGRSPSAASAAGSAAAAWRRCRAALTGGEAFLDERLGLSPRRSPGRIGRRACCDALSRRLTTRSLRRPLGVARPAGPQPGRPHRARSSTATCEGLAPPAARATSSSSSPTAARDDSLEVCQALAGASERDLRRRAGGARLGPRGASRTRRGRAATSLCFTNSARTTPEILTLMLAYATPTREVVLKANRRIRESCRRRARLAALQPRVPRAVRPLGLGHQRHAEGLPAPLRQAARS